MSQPFSAADRQRLRNRARLVEFLKFRVLASQEAFFEAWITAVDPQPTTGPAAAGSPGAPPPLRMDASRLGRLDLGGFRSWLQPLWPAAASLSDADLRHCLEQAHALYVDSPRSGAPFGRQA